MMRIYYLVMSSASRRYDMSVLNKLLNLLDDLKDENPELANKALLAAETLKAGIDPEDLEDEWEAEEEEEEEEEFDDSFVEATPEDTEKFFKYRNDLDEAAKKYGVFMRDHEVQKVALLQQIEQIRVESEKWMQSLKDEYRLDPTSEYSIEFDQSVDGNLVFVKQ